MAYTPKEWDKVFYTGSEKAYNYILFTVTNIRTASNGDTVASLDALRNGSLVSISVGDMNVLNYCYNSKPKFDVDDVVYKLGDNDLPRAGAVVEVRPSLTNDSNMYRVYFETEEECPETVLFQYDPSAPVMDSSITTLKHVANVANMMNRIARNLMERGEVHDASKYAAPEKIFLDIIEHKNTVEGPAPFGTPAYIETAKLLKPMLKHHFAHNSHHPEFYPNGIYGMTLMDIVEMACDWQAAAKRGNEDAVNLTYAAERFLMSDQLKRIFANTYEAMGVNWK